jgi:hypothetical protein
MKKINWNDVANLIQESSHILAIHKKPLDLNKYMSSSIQFVSLFILNMMIITGVDLA